jgi:hypothetical protein
MLIEDYRFLPDVEREGDDCIAPPFLHDFDLLSEDLFFPGVYF